MPEYCPSIGWIPPELWPWTLHCLNLSDDCVNDVPPILPENKLITSWTQSEYCLTFCLNICKRNCWILPYTVWIRLILGEYWLNTVWILPEHGTKSAWILPDNCLNTAWLLREYCLNNGDMQIDYCINTELILAEYCLITAWLQYWRKSLWVLSQFNQMHDASWKWYSKF